VIQLINGKLKGAFTKLIQNS